MVLETLYLAEKILENSGYVGTLIVNKINLNDPNVVNTIRKAINKLVQEPSSFYPLKFKPPYYFEIPNTKLPEERGYYIILEGKRPLYVGRTENLNKRLNTNNRSIDNFARRGRKSDSERNFIKKFVETKVLSNLRVCIIKESDFCRKLKMNSDTLTDLDRENVEKLINIFRAYFNYPL